MLLILKNEHESNYLEMLTFLKFSRCRLPEEKIQGPNIDLESKEFPVWLKVFLNLKFASNRIIELT